VRRKTQPGQNASAAGTGLSLRVVERVGPGRADLEPNRLILGDNLGVMRLLPDESLDLVYADPPFFSGRQYRAGGERKAERSFSDVWRGEISDYLDWLRPRLDEMKRLLKRTGSIYVHCDWHASHYIKVEMDKIFGYDHFINEIVWHYESGGRAARFYPRKHDSLLWYGKTKRTDFFSAAVTVPRGQCARCGSELRQWNHLKRNVDGDGRIYRTVKSAGKVYRYYDDQPTMPSDTWIGINHLQQKDPERVGYPTQKPERLLERVISGVTREGGLVADFFCGSGTTAVVAARLGRRWIACDQSPAAVAVAAERLRRLSAMACPPRTKKLRRSSAKDHSGTPPPIVMPDFTIEHAAETATGHCDS
jgi:site-specific DNA-methyltransferase (adenine-specific)/adenine-specific DNA-methyltransferase